MEKKNNRYLFESERKDNNEIFYFKNEISFVYIYYCVFVYTNETFSNFFLN